MTIRIISRLVHLPNSSDKTVHYNYHKVSTTQLSISKKELEIVFDTIPEEIFILDKEFKIVRANKKCAAMVQQPVQNLIGKICYQIFWKKDTCCEECPVKVSFEKKIPVVKQPLSLACGEKTRDYEISVYPVINDADCVYHVIEIRKDITDEKRMIEHMIRSEKLASIGKMTSGIAHEMNNPLSGISGNAVNLLAMPEKYGLNERGIIRISAIQNLATRAMAIMTDLLNLSHQPEQLFILTDINDLLTKTIKSLHISGSLYITPTFQFSNDLPHLYCDPVKLQQVVINLTKNAFHAISEKKRTMVNGHHFEGSLIVATRKINDQIAITFTDNGIGIAEENRTKIFDPFFSTKPTGEGTGLGLSVSNKIIEEHGGKIFFECTDDSTIFTLLFPLQQSRNT